MYVNVARKQEPETDYFATSSRYPAAQTMTASKPHWTTKLIHSDARPAEGFRSLVTPVFRGSTRRFSG